MTDRDQDGESARHESLESRLLTAKDVAAYLQLSPKKVYEVVGRLALCMGARRLRWRRQDIDLWLESQRRNP